jgi:hypothetical protein
MTYGEVYFYGVIPSKIVYFQRLEQDDPEDYEKLKSKTFS